MILLGFDICVWVCGGRTFLVGTRPGRCIAKAGHAWLQFAFSAWFRLLRHKLQNNFNLLNGPVIPEGAEESQNFQTYFNIPIAGTLLSMSS